MEMLQNEDKTRPIEFLSTHPAPENRSAYLKNKINSKYRNLGILKIGKEDYQIFALDRLKKLPPPEPADNKRKEPAKALRMQHSSPSDGFTIRFALPAQ
jgi:predicted Zn-dependent protease